MIDLTAKEKFTTVEQYLVDRIGINGRHRREKAGPTKPSEDLYSIETSFVVAKLADTDERAVMFSEEVARAIWKMVLRMQDIALNDSTYPDTSARYAMLPPDLAEAYCMAFVRNQLFAMLRDQAPYNGVLPADGSQTRGMNDLCINVGIYWDAEGAARKRWIQIKAFHRSQKPVYPRCVDWHSKKFTNEIYY